MELLRGSSARRLVRWSLAPTWSRNWICPSCRSQSVASRRFQSTTPSPKPYYVTTPIFYVNAAPHVGHMYSMVLADVLKRWQILKGNTALLCTGTDEHGMKVQRAAAVENMSPKEFCDETAAKFLNLADSTKIDYDRFIRTTDADHIEAVEHFWFLLREKGLIYETVHDGWYCVGDECFYPESQVSKQMDPFTGEVFMASTETGSKVEWVEEKNYHFRMTEMKSKLLEFFSENPDWIVPAARMNSVVDWVNNHLEDLSVSRPAERLTWGIRVPDDPTQTIYVWIDALINYMTMAGFPTLSPGREHEGGWPADVHVIGKDILRFHCVYWPALLLALDLPLPKRVLSHAHWTLDRKKMSKSVGNVVNPFFAIEQWGADMMRFYMIHDGGISNDADYNNVMIAERYRKQLQRTLGNLASRVVKAKAWDVGEIVADVGANGLYKINSAESDDIFNHQENLLKNLLPAVEKHMENLDSSAALHEVMELLNQTNKFISETKPWVLAKEAKDPWKMGALNRTIYFSAESLRLAGILLQPVMPEKSAELLDILGVANDKRQVQNAALYSDFDYGVPAYMPGPDGLFPPRGLDD
ncbi:tRNA synthetases class I (M)-domain-containing protein [Lasiosphaeris hirsuta]|uniref:Probable methionine--tRNA ligase, mitochondrial n=1 Tax=Lasiosphaeris hirsuta TaxID=260670 RepID=A0AA40AQB6_9PEZI|nr:tRNA synthetases class I (M)-domain-containing protein [Lasiosphaeris hirsuta]